jgi:hypothetical protein
MTFSALPTSPQQAFGALVQQIAGPAFEQLGYRQHATPMQQSRGMFRYLKMLPEGINAYVEWQILAYAGSPSKFRVNLLRNRGDDPRARTDYPARVETTLSLLLWETFNIQQLDTPEYWWTFGHPSQLSAAIVEAAKLSFGFGIPWLEGTLGPEDLT